jgi:pyruvate,orthophosphate dikinase
MPGMMDTILNLGPERCIGGRLCGQSTGNARFAYDSYRRFIQMFSDVVMGMSKTYFDSILEDTFESQKGYVYDYELTADDLQDGHKAASRRSTRKRWGTDFPQDP